MKKEEDCPFCGHWEIKLRRREREIVREIVILFYRFLVRYRFHTHFHSC